MRDASRREKYPMSQLEKDMEDDLNYLSWGYDQLLDRTHGKEGSTAARWDVHRATRSVLVAEMTRVLSNYNQRWALYLRQTQAPAPVAPAPATPRPAPPFVAPKEPVAQKVAAPPPPPAKKEELVPEPQELVELVAPPLYAADNEYQAQ